jgi:hypothetical protein
VFIITTFLNKKVEIFERLHKILEVGAAEDHKSKIHVRVFVVLLRVYSQWGLESSKPTPAGRKTAQMASS